MPAGYTIKDQFACYFITMTVHQWVDVFTREYYKQIMLDSLIYCQKEKGLQIQSYVIMTNHVHMIVRATTISLSDVLRDMKKFTAKAIYKAIEENASESIKAWMLRLLTKDEHIWFWQEGNHAEEIFSEEFFKVKLNYIHQNPVRAGIVIKEEEYLYSSAGWYYGIPNQLLSINDF